MPTKLYLYNVHCTQCTPNASHPIFAAASGSGARSGARATPTSYLGLLFFQHETKRLRAYPPGAYLLSSTFARSLIYFDALHSCTNRHPNPAPRAPTRQQSRTPTHPPAWRASSCDLACDLARLVKVGSPSERRLGERHQ